MFIDVNDTFLAKTGYARKEVLNVSSTGLKFWVHEEDREQMMADLRAGRAVINREYLIRMKNGSIITGLFSAQIINLGKEVCVLSSVTDITDRKKAEGAIKERTKELEILTKRQEEIKKALLNVMGDLNTEKSKIEELNAKNDAIIESIAEGIIITDRKGMIVRVNSWFEKLLGWKAEEVLGKDMIDVVVKVDENGEVIPRQKRSLTRVLSGELKSGRASTLITTHCYIRKDGSRMPVVGVVAAITLQGKIVGAVQLFGDVTREKELEKMKDEFMDIAAHDLRTPAAAIRGFISRVLDGDAGKISDKAKDLLKEAYEGNMRLIYLVDDFLVVSRLERGRIKINPRAGDLAEIVEDSVGGFSGLAKQKGLTLEYKKVKLPTTLVDRERIIQVVNNLVENAIKFTEKGGITISHTIGKDEVVTNITDTGVGIPPALQGQLFQKYYKGGEDISRSGLGLGLYICKLNIEGSGGKIWVESKEGKGSTFSFSLPIAK